MKKYSMKFARSITLFLAGALIVAGLTAGCGDDKAAPAAQSSAIPSSSTSAAQLRSELNRILSEHVTIAGAATNAAMKRATSREWMLSRTCLP